MPPAKRRGCVLIHNASVRRVILKTHLVNCIDGEGDTKGDWTSALENHPLGSVMKQAFTLVTGSDTEKVVIAPQRLKVVQLPPKPDHNWSWRGVFAYGDTRVGECCLKEGGVFSFICVDCGLRVGDRGESTEDLRGYDGSPSEALREYDGSPKEVCRQSSFLDVSTDASNGQEGEDLVEEGPKTTVEVVNRMDEMVRAKIFEPTTGLNGTAARLFRGALAEGSIGPGMNRLFSLKAGKDGEADFDVEIRIGRRLAKCEVVGEQFIVVDGVFPD